MQLDVFRSLWGADQKDWPDLFEELESKGFSGVEASLSDIGFPNDTSRFFDLLKKHNLKWICGLYTGWNDYLVAGWTMDSVQSHIQNFDSQLTSIQSLPQLPIQINSHTGSDHFNEQESLELFESVLKIQETSRIPISHETHRGRVLHSPWMTLRLVQTFPSLRLTLDLSHWSVVSERLIALEILEPLLDRVDHIHARVGTHESPQVGHPRQDQVIRDGFTTYYEQVWTAIWKKQQKKGRKVSTLTPEYGPVEDYYMPSSIHINTDGSRVRKGEVDLKQLIFDEAKSLRQTFDTTMKH